MSELEDEEQSPNLRSSHGPGSAGQHELVVELDQWRGVHVLPGKELNDAAKIASRVRDQPLGLRIVAAIDHHAVAHF
jgi:hypothetical protein